MPRPWHDRITKEEKDHIVILAFLKWLMEEDPKSLPHEGETMLKILGKRWGVGPGDYYSIDWDDAN